MNRVVAVAACACVPVVALLGWVSFPLSPAVSGITFRLCRVSQASALPCFMSYGCIAALLLLICAGCYWRGVFAGAYWAASLLLLLTAAAPLQVAFHDPVLLMRLTSEAEWQQQALRFAHVFEPANFGAEPTMWSSLPLTTITDRVVTGWYFMGIAWYASGILAIVLCGVALSLLDKHVVSHVVAVAVLLVAIAVTSTVPAARAERLLLQGVTDEQSGNIGQARLSYERAGRLDGWLTLRTDLHKRRGAMDGLNGKIGTSDYRIYRAEVALEEGRPREAATAYEQLAGMQEMAVFASSRAAKIWTEFGLRLYATGSIGSAVRAWQSALADDSTDWLAAFCLTRGYFALGRDHEAADLADKLSRARDPVFIANARSNEGDARSHSRDFARAHAAYRLAYQNDYVYDRRALEALVGP